VVCAWCGAHLEGNETGSVILHIQVGRGGLLNGQRAHVKAIFPLCSVREFYD
jgi:hypothetical protein